MQMQRHLRWLGSLMLSASLLLRAPVDAQEIVVLPTRPQVTQSYFLARVPREPQAVVVLFPGGRHH